MNFNLKKCVRRQIAERSVITVIIWAFLATSLMPQIVDAKTFSFASIKSIFGKNNVQAVEESKFPVIGDAEPRNTVWVTMTAYSSDVAQTDSTPCIPADSTYNLCEHYEENGARDTIAANFLPLGTQVRFPDIHGDRIFVVRDRMNARYGWGRGDFWMPIYNEAKNFGVQRVKMEIYYR